MVQGQEGVAGVAGKRELHGESKVNLRDALNRQRQRLNEHHDVGGIQQQQHPVQQQQQQDKVEGVAGDAGKRELDWESKDNLRDALNRQRQRQQLNEHQYVGGIQPQQHPVQQQQRLDKVEKLPSKDVANEHPWQHSTVGRLHPRDPYAANQPLPPSQQQPNEKKRYSDSRQWEQLQRSAQPQARQHHDGFGHGPRGTGVQAAVRLSQHPDCIEDVHKHCKRSNLQNFAVVDCLHDNIEVCSIFYMVFVVNICMKVNKLGK